MVDFQTTMILVVVIFSTIAVIVSFVSLLMARKKNNDFKAQLGDLISPQREYIENLVYKNSELLTSDYGYLTDANQILLDPSNGKDMIIRTKLPDFSFFEDMGIFLPEVKVDENMVMCLMPFNRRFDKTKAVIEESCHLAGYNFRRSAAELLANNTDLRKTIVKMILEAQVVVAVLDGRNPNVYYEIGVAHSMGKLVLMVVNLSREENRLLDVDLRSNRLITYNNPSELKEQLVKTLKAIHSDERGKKETNN